jgi:hypothetical protein
LSHCSSGSTPQLPWFLVSNSPCPTTSRTQRPSIKYFCCQKQQHSPGSQLPKSSHTKIVTQKLSHNCHAVMHVNPRNINLYHHLPFFCGFKSQHLFLSTKTFYSFTTTTTRFNTHTMTAQLPQMCPGAMQQRREPDRSET